MTNGEILKLYSVLDYLNSNTELKFSIKIGYAFAKNLEILKPEVKVIYNLRQKIFNELGTTNDKDEIIVPKERLDELGQKLDELMGIKSDIKIFQLPIDAFDELEDKLSLQDISGLSYMIYIPENIDESIN